jgi:agmatinase
MPSTGTPEPDGLSFYELKEILKVVLSKKQVIGMDFVELSPIPGFIAPNVLAAKLIYFAIGYAFNKDLQAQSE